MTPRWKVTAVLTEEPTRHLIVPVRDIKVMYALKNRHYQGFTESQIPHPHEYFVPMDAITAERGHESPAIQALVARSAVTANFLAPMAVTAVPHVPPMAALPSSAQLAF